MSRFQLPKNRLAPVTGLSTTCAVSYPPVAAASRFPPPLAKRVNDACAENTADFLRGLKQSTFPDEPTFTTGTTATRSSTVSETTSATTTTTTARSSTSGQHCDGVQFVSVPSFTTVPSSAIHPRNWTTTEEPSTHMSQHVGDFQDFTRVFDHTKGSTLASSTRFYNRTRSFTHTLSSHQSRAPSTTSRSCNSTQSFAQQSRVPSTATHSATRSATRFINNTQSFTQQSRVPSAATRSATRFTNNTKQSLTQQSLTQQSLTQQTAPPSPPVRRQSKYPDIVVKQLPSAVVPSRFEITGPRRMNETLEEDNLIIRFINKLGMDWGDEGLNPIEWASWEYRKALALNRDKCRRYLAVVFAGPMRRLKERQRKREEEERKREEEERKNAKYERRLARLRSAAHDARMRQQQRQQQQATVASEESEDISDEETESSSQFDARLDAENAACLQRHLASQAKYDAFLERQRQDQQREAKKDDDDISIMSGFSTITSMVSAAFSYVSSGAEELTRRLGLSK